MSSISSSVVPALAVPNVTAAVALALSKPSVCVPDGGVLLSMTNEYHARLRPYQFALVSHHQCLMDRTVSLCFGAINDTFGVCVYGEDVPSSDLRSQIYVALNLAKWPLFLDALRVARTVLWLEADVLLLQNPFDLLRHTTSGSDEVDIRYQRESWPCDEASRRRGNVKCSAQPEHPAPLNCGQLLLPSATFARAVWASRPSNFTNRAPTQQHHANVLLPHFRHASLPIEFFSHCWTRAPGGGTPRIANMCGLATYHFNCVPNMRQKLSLMRFKLQSVRRACARHD